MHNGIFFFHGPRVLLPTRGVSPAVRGPRGLSPALSGNGCRPPPSLACWAPVLGLGPGHRFPGDHRVFGLRPCALRSVGRVLPPPGTPAQLVTEFRFPLRGECVIRVCLLCVLTGVRARRPNRHAERLTTQKAGVSSFTHRPSSHPFIHPSSTHPSIHSLSIACQALNTLR